MVANRSAELKPHVNAMVGMVAAHIGAAVGSGNIQAIRFEINQLYLTVYLRHVGKVVCDLELELDDENIIEKLEELDRRVLKMITLKVNYDKKSLRQMNQLLEKSKNDADN